MSLTCHTAMSQWLTQKEPVRYTNKLIKKTTDTNYQLDGLSLLEACQM